MTTKDLENQNDGPSSPEAVHVVEVEKLIRQLPGVMSARVIVNDWGAIEEVHVLATTERGAKQIVRDVESSLAARWGINVDHKKISVAQVSARGTRLPPMRLKLSSLKLENDAMRGRLSVEVTLGVPTDPDLSFTGSAGGPGSGVHQYRVVAAATVEALNQAITPGNQLLLEDARLLHVAGHPIALVLINFAAGDGSEELLVGGVRAAGDPLPAFVRACLHGTNRLMEGRVRRRSPRGAGPAQADGSESPAAPANHTNAQ